MDLTSFGELVAIPLVDVKVNASGDDIDIITKKNKLRFHLVH